jgi:hypothetical protein
MADSQSSLANHVKLGGLGQWLVKQLVEPGWVLPDTKDKKETANPNLAWWAVIGTLMVLVLFCVGAGISPKPNEGIKDATAALVLITAAAVGIERILEVFWTFVDTTQGTFWPLTAIDAKVTELANEITDDAKGPLKRLKTDLDATRRTFYWTDEQVAAASGEIENLRKKVEQLKSLAPNSDNATMMTAVTTRGLNAVSAKYPTIKGEVDAATQAVNGVTDFVGSLTDNPGRRIISIYAGVVFGLVVAAAIGLDVINSTLGTVLQSPIPGFPFPDHAFKWGVALTGIVMGLGSNPTHELIKALQTYKQTQNAP